MPRRLGSCPTNHVSTPARPWPLTAVGAGAKDNSEERYTRVMDYAIGIDLGGSSVKAVAVTSAGEILQRENRDFDADHQLDFANTIKQVFFGIQQKQGQEA